MVKATCKACGETKSYPKKYTLDHWMSDHFRSSCKGIVSGNFSLIDYFVIEGRE